MTQCERAERYLTFRDQLLRLGGVLSDVPTQPVSLEAIEERDHIALLDRECGRLAAVPSSVERASRDRVTEPESPQHHTEKRM